MVVILPYTVILTTYLLSLIYPIAVIYLIPFVIITTVSEDFYFTQNEFPSFFCLSRNADFAVLYLLFPAVFLCSLGVFLLLILLVKIQMVRKSIWLYNLPLNLLLIYLWRCG